MFLSIVRWKLKQQRLHFICKMYVMFDWYSLDFMVWRITLRYVPYNSSTVLHFICKMYVMFGWYSLVFMVWRITLRYVPYNSSTVFHFICKMYVIFDWYSLVFMVWRITLRYDVPYKSSTVLCWIHILHQFPTPMT